MWLVHAKLGAVDEDRMRREREKRERERERERERVSKYIRWNGTQALGRIIFIFRIM